VTHLRSGPDDDPLALDRETMRRMGYLVVDRLVDRIDGLRDERVLTTASRAELAARIDEPPSDAAGTFEGLIDRLERDVLPFVGHFDHPRCFAYIPGSGTWPSALGDLIASATNIDSGAWREAAGPTQLELTVLEWFRGWLGYPEGAGGVLVSGGSAANLSAIACAREILAGAMTERLVLYVSDQSHSSIARAARQLGFRQDQVRVLATDEAYRLRPADLATAMDTDLAAGKQPLLVSALAGSTNTAAIDPLAELAHVAHARGAWLHVDAAYGGFAVLTERGAHALAGLATADSITLDPHKWLQMPIEVGCLMVRESRHLERAFAIVPDYLRDRAGAADRVNFADRGLQLTRASRAIKVWLGLQTFGVDAFRAVIDRSLDLAALAESIIRVDPRLELVTPASLSIVTFRRRFADDRGREDDPDRVDRLNAQLVAELAASGEVLLTSTVLHGRYAIRMCVLNHGSGADDVRFALERVASLPIHDATGSEAAQETKGASEMGMDPRWLRSHDLDSAHLRDLRLFALTPIEDADRFLAAGREHRFGAGESIVEQWAFSRDFHLVLDGRVSIRSGPRELAALGAGEVFGEIAALDWGRDFSYGRTATVVATEPGRLIAFPQAALGELMRAVPAVEHRIRALAADRLANR
jgi:glutamate/tyrosine decarboxylase-like PLP-dependent enzyme